MKLHSSQALALAIDYQLRLLPHILDSEALLHRSGILLDGLRQLNVPIHITQQYTRGLGMSHPSIYTHAGTQQYLEKRSFSCWGSDEIRNLLRKENRPQIILCGIETHICVLQTALDLLRNGYQVIFVQDCISSRYAPDRTAGFQRMLQEGAIPATTESLLFELMETSVHPEFKAISRLIR